MGREPVGVDESGTVKLPVPLEVVVKAHGFGVACVYAFYCDKARSTDGDGCRAGDVWWPNEKVAKAFGITTRSVMVYRGRLVDAGLITIQRRRGRASVVNIVSSPATEDSEGLSTEDQDVKDSSPMDSQDVKDSSPTDVKETSLQEVKDSSPTIRSREEEPLEVEPSFSSLRSEKAVLDSSLRSNLERDSSPNKPKKEASLSKKKTDQTDLFPVTKPSKAVNDQFPPGAIEEIIETHRVAFGLEDPMPLTAGVRAVLAKAILKSDFQTVRRAIIGASKDGYVIRERAHDLAFMLADDPKRQNLAKYSMAGARIERGAAAKVVEAIPEDARAYFRKHTGSFFDEMEAEEAAQAAKGITH